MRPNLVRLLCFAVALAVAAPASAQIYPVGYSGGKFPKATTLPSGFVIQTVTTTDNTYNLGDSTHRFVQLGVISLLSGASTMAVTSNVTDGSSAVGFNLYNTTALGNATARIASFGSNATEKAAILASGGGIFPTVGPNSTRQHTLPNFTSGILFVADSTTGQQNHGVVVAQGGAAPNTSIIGSSAGQVLTWNGSSADPSFSDPITATTSTATLSTAAYTITTNSPEQIGLTLSLPATGTYLILADAQAGVSTSAGTGQIIFTLVNTTLSSTFTSSERFGVQGTSGLTAGVSMHFVVTVAGATTIDLYAQTPAGPTYTFRKVLSDTNGRTRMTYIRLN